MPRAASKSQVSSRRSLQCIRTNQLQPKLKLNNYDDEDFEEAELVDLSTTLSPVSYADLGPRDYRKLHKLHSSVQTDTPSLRMTQKPTFSYKSGEEPDVPFLSNKKKKTGATTKAPEYDEEPEFPSTSALLGLDDDPFEDDPDTFMPDESNPLDAAGPYATSSYQDDSMASLEAGMIELGDSVIARPATPNVASSFCNELFDFDAYEIIDDLATTSSDSAPSDKDTMQSSALKRPLPESPDQAEVKHRRITKDEAGAESTSLPEWTNEFDSELIADFKGLVDFID